MSPVFKTMAKTFLITAACSAGLVFMTAVIVGENRRAEQMASNQWLAKDLATHFAVVGANAMARVQKYGLLVNSDAGTFELLAKREFELDSGARAVWLVQSAGELRPSPLARLEKSGFDLSDEQASQLNSAIVEATQIGSSVRDLGSGLHAVIARLEDRPRFVALIGDESIFSRASGGPLGEQWQLLQRHADGSVRLLHKSESEVMGSTTFPQLAEIERALKEESPNQERAEFSSTIESSRGSFLVSGMQTGLFGVVAIALTPLDQSVDFIEALGKLAIGLVLTLTFLSGVFSWLWQIRRIRGGGNRDEVPL